MIFGRRAAEVEEQVNRKTPQLAWFHYIGVGCETFRYVNDVSVKVFSLASIAWDLLIIVVPLIIVNVFNTEFFEIGGLWVRVPSC